MGLEKTQFFARESVCCIKRNANIELVVKQYTSCLAYQGTQSKEKHYIMKYHSDLGK